MRRAFLFVLILATAAVAGAGTFLPLHDNAQWTYENEAGQTMTITATGHALVRGIPCVELRWELPDQIFKNYWTTDRDGSVYLHGAMNESGGFQAAYSPALHWLPAADATARCWSTSSRMFFSLFGDSNTGAEIDIEFCVTGGGPVSTPAGDFDTVAVSVTTELFPAKDVLGYNVFGRRLDSAAKDVDSEWFSLDVGMVRDMEWTLVSYDAITSNEEFAWGAVKTLYR